MSNSSEIQIRIAAVSAGVQETVQQLRDLEAGLKSETSTTQQAVPAIQAHASAQTTLHGVLDTSRRQTLFLEQSIVSATGATGAFGSAISVLGRGFEALMTGVGPVGLLVVGFSAAIGVVTQKVQEQQKAIEADGAAILKFAEDQTKANLSLAKYGTELIAASQADATHKAAIKGDADELARLEGQINTTQAYMRQLANSTMDAADKDEAMAQRTRELKDLTEQHDAIVRRLTDSLRTNTSVIGDASGALLEFTGITDRAAGATRILGYDADTAYASLMRLSGAYKDAGANRAEGGLLDTQAGAPGTAATQLYVNASEGRIQVARDEYKETERLGVQAANAIEAANKSMGTAARAAAEQIKQAYIDAANSAKSALDSLIAAEEKVSSVSALDVKQSKAGTYVDKADETIRRVRIFENAPSIDANEDLKRMFALLPVQAQAQLKEAFGKSTAAGQLKAGEIVQNMVNFTDLSGWDVGKLADAVQAKMTEAANQKKLTGEVEVELKARGIDTKDPEVQKQLGIETGAEKTLKINAALSFQEGQIQASLSETLKKTSMAPGLGVAVKTEAEQKALEVVGQTGVGPPLLKGLGDYLGISGDTLANALMNAIGASDKAMTAVGTKIGSVVVKGLAAQITAEADALSGALYNAFKKFGDANYVKLKNPGTVAP